MDIGAAPIGCRFDGIGGPCGGAGIGGRMTGGCMACGWADGAWVDGGCMTGGWTLGGCMSCGAGGTCRVGGWVGGGWAGDGCVTGGWVGGACLIGGCAAGTGEIGSRGGAAEVCRVGSCAADRVWRASATPPSRRPKSRNSSARRKSGSCPESALGMAPVSRATANSGTVVLLISRIRSGHGLPEHDRPDLPGAKVQVNAVRYRVFGQRSTE